MWRLLICFILLGTITEAGPLPREKGEVFLALSVQAPRLTSTDSLYGNIYTEMGIGNELILGLDAGGDGFSMSKIVGFLRWPDKKKTGRLKVAYDFGIGQIDNRFAVRSGISAGGGFDLGQNRSGWAVLDMRTAIFDFTGLVNTEIDATLGASLNPDLKIIFQLQGGLPALELPYLRAAPSAIYQIKPNHHIEVGLVAGVLYEKGTQIKLGFWRQF